MKNIASFQMHTEKTQTSLMIEIVVVVVLLLFYVHGKQLRSCLDGQLT